MSKLQKSSVESKVLKMQKSSVESIKEYSIKNKISQYHKVHLVVLTIEKMRGIMWANKAQGSITESMLIKKERLR